MNTVAVKLLDGFEMSIPDLFEEVWEEVSQPTNLRSHYNLGCNQTRDIYGVEKGSTAISTFRVNYMQEDKIRRCIIIRYDYRYADQQEFVMHHDSATGKYRLALPLIRSLTNPLDEPVQ